MNAKIDIITPSGKSLEGFPQILELDSNSQRIQGLISELYYGDTFDNIKLTPGDKIIIEVLHD